MGSNQKPIQECTHRGDKQTYKLPYNVTARVCLLCSIRLRQRLDFELDTNAVGKWIKKLEAKSANRKVSLEDFFDHYEECGKCRDAIETELGCAVGIELWLLAHGAETPLGKQQAVTA